MGSLILKSLLWLLLLFKSYVILTFYFYMGCKKVAHLLHQGIIVDKAPLTASTNEALNVSTWRHVYVLFMWSPNTAHCCSPVSPAPVSEDSETRVYFTIMLPHLAVCINTKQEKAGGNLVQGVCVKEPRLPGVDGVTHPLTSHGYQLDTQPQLPSQKAGVRGAGVFSGKKNQLFCKTVYQSNHLYKECLFYHTWFWYFALCA